MSSVALDPAGTRARLGRVVLQSRGVTGDATATKPAHPDVPGGAATRGLVAASGNLDDALERHGLRVTDVVEISQPRDLVARAPGHAGATEPELQIEVPPPDEGFGQVVLSTSETDVMTWHFAQPSPRARDLSHGSSVTEAGNVYVVPRLGGRPQAPVARGLLTALGKHILKVLVFPLVEKGIGKLGDAFAGRWEQARRKPRLRSFTAGDHGSIDATKVEGRAWSHLAQGPSALFVHGTFSLTHTGFGTLPAGVVEELHRIYNGRVIAFDHPSLSLEPIDNARWLLQQVPAECPLEVDIVAHSRGGLVARSLMADPDLPSELAGRLRVRKIIFVATPNAGTVLADPANLKAFVDTYTNILNFFPTVGVVDVLDAIVTVVKMIGAGVLAGLPGLRSMVPGGAFLERLNQPSGLTAMQFALASNFEPKPESGLVAFKDRVADAVFRSSNDLTVPTEGVYEHNGAAGFPIKDRLVFAPGDGVHHSGFFEHRRATDQMLAWLAL